MLFRAMASTRVFDSVVGLLEEVLALRAETFDLSTVPNLEELVVTLSTRRLAYFCRVLAMVVFEPEPKPPKKSSQSTSKGGGPTNLATVKSLYLLGIRKRVRREFTKIVDRNHAILLGIEILPRRLILLLRGSKKASRKGKGASSAKSGPPPTDQEMIMLFNALQQQSTDRSDQNGKDWEELEKEDSILAFATGAAAATAATMQQEQLEQQAETGGDGGNLRENGYPISEGQARAIRTLYQTVQAQLSQDSNNNVDTSTASSAFRERDIQRRAQALTLKALTLATHQVEVLFVLCTLLSGKRKHEMQMRLAFHNVVPILSVLFDNLEWGKLPPPLPPAHLRLHGPDCECNPENALKVQFLRLIHTFCDSNRRKPAHRECDQYRRRRTSAPHSFNFNRWGGFKWLLLETKQRQFIHSRDVLVRDHAQSAQERKMLSRAGVQLNDLQSRAEDYMKGIPGKDGGENRLQEAASQIMEQISYLTTRYETLRSVWTPSVNGKDGIDVDDFMEDLENCQYALSHLECQAALPLWWAEKHHNEKVNSSVTKDASPRTRNRTAVEREQRLLRLQEEEDDRIREEGHDRHMKAKKDDDVEERTQSFLENLWERGHNAANPSSLGAVIAGMSLDFIKSLAKGSGDGNAKAKQSVLRTLSRPYRKLDNPLDKTVVAGDGLLSKIIGALIKEPVTSPYRFWLSSCLEAFLRGGSCVEQHFVGTWSSGDSDNSIYLLEHIVHSILTHDDWKVEDRAAGNLQTNFDLLGELIKFNRRGLVLLNDCLQNWSKTRQSTDDAEESGGKDGNIARSFYETADGVIDADATGHAVRETESSYSGDVDGGGGGGGGRCSGNPFACEGFDRLMAIARSHLVESNVFLRSIALTLERALREDLDKVVPRDFDHRHDLQHCPFAVYISSHRFDILRSVSVC